MAGLTNSEAWARATDEARKARADLVGPLDDGSGPEDIPADDRAFWDDVEKRAVALGGAPAGPAAA